MARADYETGEKLFTPFIEISLADNPKICAYVNVKTFEKCYPHLQRDKSMYPGTQKEYEIWQAITPPDRGGQVGVDTAYYGRVSSGFIKEEILEKYLSQTHASLERVFQNT